MTKDTERLYLSETFHLLDSTEITKVEDKNIGTLLSHVRDSIVEADNKACGAMVVQDSAGEIKYTCCQEVQRNRNVFLL